MSSIIQLPPLLAFMDRVQIFHPGGPYMKEFCFWAMMVFLILACVLFVVILVSRLMVNKRNDNYRHYEDEASPILTDFLFTVEDQEAFTNEDMLRVTGELREKGLLDNKLSNKAIKDQLMALHKQFKGLSQQVIEALYLELKYHKVAIDKVKNGEWYEQADAIQELSEMDVEEALPHIQKLVNHPNKFVRLQVELAILRLNRSHPLHFLDKANFQLSDWHQINLFHTIKYFRLEDMPSFYNWLRSPNDSVVVFAIRVIRHFNQFETESRLLSLLNHPSVAVQREVIAFISTFGSDAGIDSLIRNYKDSPREVKPDILYCLGNVGTPEAIYFLHDVMVGEQDQVMSMTAAQALFASSEDGQELVLKQYPNGHPGLTLVLNEIEPVAATVAVASTVSDTVIDPAVTAADSSEDILEPQPQPQS